MKTMAKINGGTHVGQDPAKPKKRLVLNAFVEMCKLAIMHAVKTGLTFDR